MSTAPATRLAGSVTAGPLTLVMSGDAGPFSAQLSARELESALWQVDVALDAPTAAVP